MITDNLIGLMNMYNDAHGWSKEIDNFIRFLMDVDNEVINGTEEEKERYINKYLEIYGNIGRY